MSASRREFAGGGNRRSDSGARRCAHRVLQSWITDPTIRVGEELDHAVQAAGLAPRDRGLARELVYGSVRRQRFHDHVLSGLLDRGLPERPELLAALRLGVVQLLDLDRVPDHAAVAATVDCLPPRRRGLVNAVLRRLARSLATPSDATDSDVLTLSDGRTFHCPVPLPSAEREPVARAALLAGVPDWLAERWEQQLGTSDALAVCAASNRVPGTHLRVRTRPVDAVFDELRQAGVEVTRHRDHAGVLTHTGGGGEASPFSSTAWQRGELLVQDPTAVRAAEAVAAKPGERVLDLCAAPGTKATLLADAVGSTGHVVAHDIDGGRLGRVRDNAERLQIGWIRATTALSTDREQEPADFDFDRVLVDVPCSNTGVIARRVEVRHTLESERFAVLAELQAELLDSAFDRTREGGTVVYSTCSIEVEENRAVVDRVASERSDVRLVRDQLTLPDPPHHDGGYFAVLERAPFS